MVAADVGIGCKSVDEVVAPSHTKSALALALADALAADPDIRGDHGNIPL